MCSTKNQKKKVILVQYVVVIVGDAQDPINYVTNFRLNKYSLSYLLFSEIVNLIKSLIKTIDLLS